MSQRFKPVAILPTLCTLGNTFCGFLAIAKVADGLLHTEAFAENILWAAWMILLAMVFDALDGRIARMTKQESEFGAQLDSLTDLITFGVAPAFLVKVVFEHTMTTHGIPYQQKFTLLLSAIYVICATLRLARFTLETETGEEAHERFFGLPTPAAAGVVASAVFLLFESQSPLGDMSVERQILGARIFLWSLPVLGVMMVSRVEYVHLVSRWFRGRRPFLHLVAILVFLFLATAYHETVFFLSFAGYAVAGPILAFAEKMAGRRLFAPKEMEDLPHASSGRVDVLVALGSNLGDRQRHLELAVERLSLLPETELIRVSDFLESEPLGGPPQREYLNGVALLRSSLAPEQLLRQLMSIETALGRERTVRHGPRVLDLDLILHGRVICETDLLTLPHPRFRERPFVLIPAAQVAPNLVDPVTGKSMRQLAEAGKVPRTH
ncbi:MAG: 2-amino-4-hydroxy-6-hydroxymethyldihydropteridine diphosphokinase [Planctomycetota bacterium]